IGLNSGVSEKIDGFGKLAILQIASRVSNQHPALPGRLKFDQNCFAQFFVCKFSLLVLFGNRGAIRNNQFAYRPGVDNTHGNVDWPASMSLSSFSAALNFAP